MLNTCYYTPVRIFKHETCVLTSNQRILLTHEVLL